MLMSSGFSYWMAYQLRFDFEVPGAFAAQCFTFLPYISLGKVLIFFGLRGHATNWRYVGLHDAVFLVLYAIICALLLWSGWLVSEFYSIPRGVIAIDAMLTLIITGGIRVSARLVRENIILRLGGSRNLDQQDAIIIGAGDAGEIILREMRRNPRTGFAVKAFFDDDRTKKGMSIHGVRVEGTVGDVQAYVESTPVEAAIVALPSANRHQMKRIYDVLRQANLSIKTLPPLLETMDGPAWLDQLRDIDITDILGREEIKIDSEQVHDLISGRVVLITGAGGSIGSEFCRQVLKRDPDVLIMLDKSENNLFHLHRRLVSERPKNCTTKLVPMLADVRTKAAVYGTMERFHPDLVFHAAAHKHVGMQELNPAECFKNNVGGIQTIARASHELGVDRFLLISTDKAVNPTSVMGASKRVAELYCQAYGMISSTSFMSVRFGNVLASEGSVVPIFMDQIKNNGPVTVTHPEVRRYFMTIPEAITLILQAAAIGESGNVLVLDMGEPVKILDVARHLIDLAGKSEEEIPIEFVGLRPGEKLSEIITCPGEVCLPTEHEKIKIFRHDLEYPHAVIEKIDDSVETVFNSSDTLDVRRILQEIVPEYQPMAVVDPSLPEPGHTDESTEEVRVGPSGISAP
jgi:FlaA1/EpsC-like NDP-sugar epimerase